MSRRLALRLGAVAAGTMALLVGVPTAASAHPLGNFTVNRYSAVVVSPEAVTVDHVLDLAEIPTAQRSPAIDTSGDGQLSRAELARWAATACSDATAALRLTVDGTRAALAVRTLAARTLKGQAGLPTLRLECTLTAPIAVNGPVTVALSDSAADDEVGWREMIARGDRTTLARSDVPRRSRSARLTAYPSDLLKSPLDVRELTLSVRPGGPRLAGSGAISLSGDATTAEALSRGSDRLTLAFQGLLTRTQGNPWLGIVAVFAALALGAAHAVAPGHGKTIMAFYLSGRREGALRSAATVGATVTATHTAGVLALGLLVSAGTAFVPARVYPWLSVVSGLLVVLVGLALLRESDTRRTRVHADGTHSHGLLGTPHSHTTPTTVSSGHAASGILVGAASTPAETHFLVAADQATLGILVRETEHDHAQAPDHGADQHSHGDHQHGHDGHAHDGGHQRDAHQRDGHAHDGHAHDGHAHDGHARDGHARDGHAHGADPAGPAPPSRRGLIAMGLAGGLLPSPSALLVLLGAVALGHAWFGVALVVAFGLGMAATLAVVGLVVMRLRERAELRLRTHPASRFAPLLRIAPVVTAVFVVVLGAVLAWRGFGATGVL